MFATPATEEIRAPSRSVDKPDALEVGAVIGTNRTFAKPTVTLVEWSDFQCPFCAKMATTLKGLRQRHDEQLRILYRYLPLPIHKAAYAAALTATCAEEQGRFEAMHDVLFASQSQLGTLPWEQFASLAKVPDSLQFEACMKSRRHANTIEVDLNVADSLRISGTPAVLINGKLFMGAVPEQQLEAEISAALKR
jgi:protein-disulfide isomerase